MKKLLTCLVLITFALAGCSGPKSEKERFVEATKEVTCMVFKSDNLFDPSLEQKSSDIFKKFGFDTKDESTLKTLTTKYRDDADVKKAVEDAMKECGGDLAKKFEKTNVVVPTVAPDDAKMDVSTEAKKTPEGDKEIPGI